MNQDQLGGVIERVIYGAVLFLAMKAVAAGWLESADAPWLAGGVVAAVGSALAWWKSKPANLLDRAANAMPGNTKLVMEPTTSATSTEKATISSLNSQTGPKVQARG